MPLPQALLAKLSKRGIISVPKISSDKDPKEFLLCPNKYNIYHDCTNWCHTHWRGFETPPPRYAKNMKKILEKYPLPSGWLEIFDRGIGRIYFWDTEKNLVSWLPPKHPDAKITETASKLRQIKNGQYKKPTVEKDDHVISRDTTERRKTSHKSWHKSDDRSDKYRKKPRKDMLDPMDPAAYSDIPRGTWSDGLEVNKGKADNTATGALFQQRPYPAPGEVLAANKKSKK